MAQIEALEDLNDLSDMLEYLTEDELEALVDMYGDDLAELFDD